jgi:cation efflux family protein
MTPRPTATSPLPTARLFVPAADRIVVQCMTSDAKVVTQRRPARLASLPGTEKKTLVLVLSINVAMFVIELTAGWIAESMGLIADSLDMFADAGVYAAALLVVGRSTRRFRGRPAREGRQRAGLPGVLRGTGRRAPRRELGRGLPHPGLQPLLVPGHGA